MEFRMLAPKPSESRLALAWTRRGRDRRAEGLEAEGKLAALDRLRAVLELSPAGEILSANQNFLRATGYSLDEICGQHHSIFVDPSYRQSAEYRLFWDKLGRGEYDADQYKCI